MTTIRIISLREEKKKCSIHFVIDNFPFEIEVSMKGKKKTLVRSTKKFEDAVPLLYEHLEFILKRF